MVPVGIDNINDIDLTKLEFSRRLNSVWQLWSLTITSLNTDREMISYTTRGFD